MTVAVTPYRPWLTQVNSGGQPIVIAYGPLIGGVITNPTTAVDQGIGTVEALYIDVVNPATPYESATTIPIQPGQSYTLPTNLGLGSNVSVNAATSGHKFSAVIWQPKTTPVPVPPVGPFPPSGPTTLTKVIPSYLYKEYDDDDDLQALVGAYNSTAQQYVSWFANVELPVYTGPTITGGLLDWVALGIYGMARPSLASGRNLNEGPFNTYKFNTLNFNGHKVIGPQNITAVSDDIFKRIITWNFYKGDGNVFNVRWLKRRIMRFLLGADGSAPNVNNTNQVSVTFGINNQVNIRLIDGVRTWQSGSRFNRFKIGQGMPFNSVTTTFSPITPLPNAAVFKQAVDTGVLQLPFQFDWVVLI